MHQGNLSFTDYWYQTFNYTERADRIYIGPFYNLVEVGGKMGICSHLQGTCHQPTPPEQKGEDYLHMTGAQLLKCYQSSNSLETAINIAWINAQINREEIAPAYTQANAFDLIKERGKGKRVVVLGHFPFPKGFCDQFQSFDIVELQPQPGDVHYNNAQQIIHQAEVLAFTSTTLVNHTFEEFIQWKNKKAYAIMMGFSAPLWAGFFDWGVDAIATSIITNPTSIWDQVQKPTPFKKLKDIKKIIIEKK